MGNTTSTKSRTSAARIPPAVSLYFSGEPLPEQLLRTQHAYWPTLFGSFYAFAPRTQDDHIRCVQLLAMAAQDLSASDASRLALNFQLLLEACTIRIHHLVYISSSATNPKNINVDDNAQMNVPESGQGDQRSELIGALIFFRVVMQLLLYPSPDQIVLRKICIGMEQVNNMSSLSSSSSSSDAQAQTSSESESKPESKSESWIEKFARASLCLLCDSLQCSDAPLIIALSQAIQAFLLVVPRATSMEEHLSFRRDMIQASYVFGKHENSSLLLQLLLVALNCRSATSKTEGIRSALSLATKPALFRDMFSLNYLWTSDTNASGGHGAPSPGSENASSYSPNPTRTAQDLLFVDDSSERGDILSSLECARLLIMLSIGVPEFSVLYSDLSSSIKIHTIKGPPRSPQQPLQLAQLPLLSSSQSLSSSLLSKVTTVSLSSGLLYTPDKSLFDHVYQALGMWLNQPEYGLILTYILVSRSRRFRNFAISRTEPEELLSGILLGISSCLEIIDEERKQSASTDSAAGGVRDAQSPSSQQSSSMQSPSLEIHVSSLASKNLLRYKTARTGVQAGAVALLLFCEDWGFCEALQSMQLPTNASTALLQKQMRISAFSSMSLTSIMTFVLARVVCAPSEAFLPFDTKFACLTVMGNTARERTKIDVNEAERLLSMLDLLWRRYRRLSAYIAECKAVESRSVVLLHDQDAAMELIVLVLEIICRILRNGMESNKHLLYSLLHKEELVLSLLDYRHEQQYSSRFRALASRLIYVVKLLSLEIDHYALSLLGPDESISVDRVLKISTELAHDLNFHALLDQLPEIQYAYEKTGSWSDSLQSNRKQVDSAVQKHIYQSLNSNIYPSGAGYQSNPERDLVESVIIKDSVFSYNGSSLVS